jgi:hypothetical protein
VDSLRVAFGKPEHGWLPVSIRLGEKLLEFDASDVPVNPVDELVEALLAVTDGHPKTVWWHLEPLGYYCYFTPQSKEVQLRITFEGHFGGEQEITIAILPKQDVLLAFWSAIQTLLSYDLGEYDWPKLAVENLRILEEKMQKLGA